MIEVECRTLPAGQLLWCVHESRYAATSFNPNLGGHRDDIATGGRFHPFEDGAGRRVPTRYLADHPNGAFAETLMRESSMGRTLPPDTILDHRPSQVRTRRSLRLVDLGTIDPDGAFARAMQADASAYRQTRSVAATLHGSLPEVDGLLWSGVQLRTPGMECVVLFGDRVTEAALAAERTLELDVGEGLRRLEAAAMHRQVTLPSALARRAPENEGRGPSGNDAG